MTFSADITERPADIDLPVRAVISSIAAFWIGWIILMSLRAWLLGFDEPADLLLRRLVAAIGGAALTLIFWRGLRMARSDTPSIIAAVALAGAVPATVVFASLNWFLFYGWYPPAALAADIARWGYGRVFRYGVIDTSISWFFFFAGWGIFYLFMRAAARSAAAGRAAADAQLQALRYQINPHFLFNALNALADLVQTGRAHEADRMILDLSGMLRHMLSDADAPADIALADEVELQRLYLALEGRRFEDRLLVEIDLPELLVDVPVPRLILQPLVENAIKHAVGGTHERVTIWIKAAACDGRLTLTVCDNGRAAQTNRTGFGIGLANVRNRLSLRYGKSARLFAGPREVGGYCVKIELPHG
jgi:signal transduction histidine kinase